MPAYNAAKTLENTYQEIPKGLVDDILVVDDASSDETVELVRKLGLNLIIHGQNLGYGANQKTCYKAALKLGADIVVMLHPDYQYDPKYMKYLINPVVDGSFDIMLGSRIRQRSETLKNGMPLYKYIANRLLTVAENIVLGLNLSEYHTGYRAYHMRVLKKLDLESFSNDFVFDQQILIKAHQQGFRIGEVFAPSYYRKDSSSINFRRSIKYGWDILANLARYILNR